MAEQHLNNSQERPVERTVRRRRSGGVHRALTVIGTLLLVFAITCSFLACFAAVYIKTVILPQTELDVADYPMNLSSTIYYTDSETGAVSEYETLHGDQNRVWVAYSEIPQDLVHAAVSIEDRRFYDHHGVDWIRTAKSILTMFTGGSIQGGSTITQQLIKNLTTYDDVTVKRKVLEIFRALEFDKKYSKEQTLEWYLNYIYFGRRSYGVYTASYAYFGKSVDQLSLAECASLISITNNPSLYDPYTHPEQNNYRRGLVLDAMCKEGYISGAERDAAKAEVLDFHSANTGDQNNTVYSWYTEQVITDVTNDLMKTYDYSETVARDLVYSGGLEIYACVDPKVQASVDEVYSNAKNLPYTSASGQQLQSAIVIVDPQGNIVGLSGKIGEKTAKDTRGWNRATRTIRQPGSAIKPLAVYAPALEMGLITPYSVFEDSPPMLLDGKPWPSNVNHRYTGLMTVSNAVTNSTNTVAVRVLQKVTPEVGFEYMEDKFGVDPNHLVVSRTINGKEYSDIGYSQMALGGLTDGVSTLDMAGAYSVFPRDGVYIKPRTYSKVVDSNGKELLTQEVSGEAVLKEKTTYYINEMLKDVVNDGSGTYANFAGMTIAGKTGSTNSNNDRWFVGYTPYYTAAVWVGYDNPERVKASGNPAASLWKMVMSQVHEGLENKDFTKPDGLVAVSYCLDSGMKAAEECKSDMRGSRAAVGYFFPEDAPTEFCNLHTMVEVCTDSPILNEAGEPTGRYHLAGEFCPEATVGEGGTTTKGRTSVSVLNLTREYLGGVIPEDNPYLLSSVEAAGTCTVHTGKAVEEPNPYDPSKFDITDPSTWPTSEQDPNFDPGDPSTWPTSGSHTTTPEPTQSGTHTTEPTVSPSVTQPPAAHTPAPSQSAGDGDDDPLLPPGA